MSDFDEPTLDPAAIAELRSLGAEASGGLFAELVELFTSGTPQLLSQACHALDDPIRLAEIAHSLKGSCSNFGAKRMERLCAELEQRGRARKTAEAREVINQIEAEYFRVRQALLAAQ